MASEKKIAATALSTAGEVERRQGKTVQISDIYSKARNISARDLGMLPGTDITDRLIEVVTGTKYRDITIYFERKAIYIITKPIIIDLFRYSIEGNGCFFNCSIGDKTKYAISLTSSASVNYDGIVNNGASPGGNTNNVFRGVIMQCPNRDKNCSGLFIGNINGIGKSAHHYIERIAMFGFETGLSFGNNAYMITLMYAAIQFCATGIFLDGTYEDIGERITLDSSTIGDCQLMVKNTSDQAMHFQNTSFDFSDKFFENSGQLYFTNCHIEAPERYLQITNPDYYWGELTGNGSCIIVGSRMFLGSGAAQLKRAIYNLNGPFTYLNISECHLNAYASYMAVGTGRIRMTGIKRYNNGSPHTLAKDGLNLYPDETCQYLPSKSDLFSIHIGADNSLDMETLQPELVTGGGYRFTHKTINQNSRVYLKIPTRGMRGGSLILVVNVPEGQAADAINFAQLVYVIGNSRKMMGVNQSGFTLVPGDNTLNITIGSMYNGAGNADNPIHEDLHILLNTFKPASGTQFIIKSVRLRPREYE